MKPPKTKAAKLPVLRPTPDEELEKRYEIIKQEATFSIFHSSGYLTRLFDPDQRRVAAVVTATSAAFHYPMEVYIGRTLGINMYEDTSKIDGDSYGKAMDYADGCVGIDEADYADECASEVLEQEAADAEAFAQKIAAAEPMTVLTLVHSRK